MIVLLLAMITAAIGTQVFADQIQTLLDGFAFSRAPQLHQDEWKRLTRRALSNMGNLPRLATSNIAAFPLIYVRLTKEGRQDDTLERAAELGFFIGEIISCHLAFGFFVGDIEVFIK
jgi:hypothetical protein